MFEQQISVSFNMEISKNPGITALTGDCLWRDPRFEVTWETTDQQNPRTWSVWYRSFIVASMSFSTTIVYVNPRICHSMISMVSLGN